MTSVWTASGLLTCLLIIATPRAGFCQAPSQSPNSPVPSDAHLEYGPWEAAFAVRIGFPIGTLQSLDRPVQGTRLSFNDLGLDVSESLEGNVAFAFTRQDAVRVSFLYSFLDGSANHGFPIFYNGQLFKPGSLHTNADFYRFSLAYERTLIDLPSSDRVVGSLGLTYVSFGPTLEGSGIKTTEHFSDVTSHRVLPVPIVGARWDHPLADDLIFRTSLLGGFLPRVDSLRAEEEGHTLYFEQANVDVRVGLAYSIWRKVQIEGGYHFSYFRQRDTSLEDINLIESIDNGFYLALSARF